MGGGLGEVVTNGEINNRGDGGEGESSVHMVELRLRGGDGRGEVG